LVEATAARIVAVKSAAGVKGYGNDQAVGSYTFNYGEPMGRN
jgi:hypothetical protein